MVPTNQSSQKVARFGATAVLSCPIGPPGVDGLARLGPDVDAEALVCAVVAKASRWTGINRFVLDSEYLTVR
jgi:hypothetical protein